MVFMISRFNFRSLSVLLAALLFSAGCADNADPVGFRAPQFDVDMKPYVALAAPGHTDITVTAELGKKGGYLIAPAANNGANSYGYVVVVEPNTVRKPTTFTMRVVGGTQYHVELFATQTQADGSVIDAGGQFAKPVLLAIQVNDSPSLAQASKLTVLYIPDDGSAPQPVPTTFDTTHGYVIGSLAHFSVYSVAMN
jgi:hypothetical protein